MKVHVITPFHRKYLAKTLVHYLRPMHIQWYPIMAPSEVVEFDEGWIHPVHIRERKSGEGIAYKQNHFIENCFIYDDDYYCNMMDDDMYEPGFFDMVKQHTAKIIVCSLYRGDTVPRNPTGYGDMRHPATTIRIHRLQGMRPGHIDIMQYIVKGEIFKRHRFEVEHPMADGAYAQMLAENYSADIVFEPTWYGLFNYFQPGRYTVERALPESNWKLPEIIK